VVGLNHPATDGENGEKVAGFRKLMEIQSAFSGSILPAIY